MSKTAIILAAGVGSRLRPITNSVPKCCVPVAGIPLIRRIVSQLRKSAPDLPIRVAVGYLADAVREELAAFGGDIAAVENAEYASTNNMESCRMVFDGIDAGDEVIIINGDCIYDDAVVSKMLAADSDVIAVDSSVFFEESMKVLLDDTRVVDIAKSIADGENVRTSIDFYKFSPAAAQALYAIMRSYHDSGDLNQWTEVAIRDLLASGSFNIATVDIAGAPWVEIDNFDDLAKANGIWK